MGGEWVRFVHHESKEKTSRQDAKSAKAAKKRKEIWGRRALPRLQFDNPAFFLALLAAWREVFSVPSVSPW